MPERTPEEFERAAAEHMISWWPIRKCGFCETDIGYVFRDGAAFFDSNCGCVPYISAWTVREWVDVAKQYNLQTSPEVIAEYDRFWHFEPEENAHA